MSRCIPPAVTNGSGVNVFFPSKQFIFTVQETQHAGNKKILTYYLKHEIIILADTIALISLNPTGFYCS